MAYANVSLKQRSFGQTMRPDAWWLRPALVFLGLSAFVVYSTWAAFQGEHYFSGPYLSPFYSPEILGSSPHSLFGPKPGWWPDWLPFSPALLILWAPGFFRLTCYYYRGAYYKAFWADPPACAVGEPRKTYLGERSFPLIMQNVHRYFLYIALVEGDVVRRSIYGKGDVWHWHWHAGAGSECGPACRVRVRMPLAATSSGWIPRSDVQSAALPIHLSVRELLQPSPYAVGLDEPLFRDVCGYLCKAVLDGDLVGCETAVKG
jgi:hypothetical protein